MRPLLIGFTVLACAFAQDKAAGPLAGDASASYRQIKGYILKSAEKMPAENFGFRPVEGVRTFGELLVHIADSNNVICAAAKDEKRAFGELEKSVKTREEAIKALNESFAGCDAVFAAMTDAKASERIKFFGGERSRLAVLNVNTMHDYEHYGNLVTYMRLKNIVPPSSEPRR